MAEVGQVVHDSLPWEDSVPARVLSYKSVERVGASVPRRSRRGAVRRLSYGPQLRQEILGGCEPTAIRGEAGGNLQRRGASKIGRVGARFKPGCLDPGALDLLRQLSCSPSTAHLEAQ
jgi:hypothetical protein